MSCGQNNTASLDFPSCLCQRRYYYFQIFARRLQRMRSGPPKKQIELENNKQMDQMEGESCHYYRRKKKSFRLQQTGERKANASV